MLLGNNESFCELQALLFAPCDKPLQRANCVAQRHGADDP